MHPLQAEIFSIWWKASKIKQEWEVMFLFDECMWVVVDSAA